MKNFLLIALLLAYTFNLKANQYIILTESNIILNVLLLIENSKQNGQDADIYILKKGFGDTIVTIENRHVTNLYLDFNSTYTIRFEKAGFVKKEITIYTPSERWVSGPIQYDIEVALFHLPLQLDKYYFKMASLKFNKRQRTFYFDKSEANEAKLQLNNYLELVKGKEKFTAKI